MLSKDKPLTCLLEIGKGYKSRITVNQTSLFLAEKGLCCNITFQLNVKCLLITTTTQIISFFNTYGASYNRWRWLFDCLLWARNGKWSEN